MDKQRWQRIKQWFNQALALPESQRDDFLRQQTVDDDAARQQILDMLAAEAQPAANITHAVYDNLQTLISSQFSINPGDRLGAYQISGLIGEGGMGAVYRAERIDQEFTQQVAIKLIQAGALNSQTLQRFQTERQILANLNHPNIARLLDGGTTEQGVPYLVMEYVEGQPIVDYCRTQHLNINHRLKLFLQVCAAVNYAHQHLIVHRDIKPTNILVTDEGQVKLLDFGIAKILHGDKAALPASETRSEMRLLTPENATPEQILGTEITTRTDVYALGNLLYQMLTERKLFDFEKENRLALERLICEQTPQKPSQALATKYSLLQRKHDAIATSSLRKLRQTLQGDIDTIILKALQKDPARRYDSVEQLSADVTRYLKKFPIHARPDSLGYRATRFFQRNRLLTSVAGVFAVSVIIFIVVILIQSSALRQQTKRAVFEADNANQISNFMIDIFDASDPNINSGEALNASQLLENGEQKIDLLKHNPLLQAAMLQAIGRVYQKLGNYDKALEMIERASRLIEASSDGSLDLRIENRLVRADLQYELGNYADSEASYRQSLQWLHASINADEDTIISAQLGLVALLTEQEKNTEALPLQQKILQRQLAQHGENSAEVGEAWTFLGMVQRKLANYEASENSLRKGLKAKRAAYGNHHLETAHSLNQLARTLTFTKKYAEAEKLALEGLQIRRGIHQGNNLEVAASLGNLSHILTAAKNYQQAAKYRFQSIEQIRAIFGEDHPYVPGSLGSLGDLYRKSGDLHQAEQTFLQSIKLWRKISADPGIKIASPMAGLGQTYLDMKQPRKALPWLRQGYDLRKKMLDADNWHIAASLSQIGQAYFALQQFDEAEKALLQALKIFKASLEPNDEKILLVKKHLFNLYQATGQATKARLYQSTISADNA